MEQKQVQINGKKVTYYTAGSGKPVVFLHGWGSGGVMASFLVSALPDRQIIAPDFPGFGGSDKPDSEYAVQDYAQWLVSFCDALHISHSDFIAHSFGARIVAKAYGIKSDLFGKLVLTGAAGIEHKSLKVRVKIALAKIAKRLLSVDMKEKILSAFGNQEYVESGLMRETYKKTVGEDLSQSFAKITQSTLLIFGQDDQDTPLTAAHELNMLIKGSELVVIPHAGHFAFLDQPQRFIMELKKFL